MLQNETHKLSFQTYKFKNYHCVMEENSELAEQLAGRRKYQEMANKMARRSALEVKYDKATRRSVVDNMEVWTCIDFCTPLLGMGAGDFVHAMCVYVQPRQIEKTTQVHDATYR